MNDSIVGREFLPPENNVRLESSLVIDGEREGLPLHFHAYLLP